MKKTHALIGIAFTAVLIIAFATLYAPHTFINIIGNAGLGIQGGQQQPEPKPDVVPIKVAGTINIYKTTPTGQLVKVAYFTSHDPEETQIPRIFLASVLPIGSWTKMGVNCTWGKVTGIAANYNMTQYNYNVTSISIGNQGTLNTDSNVLPGEWNRTAATSSTPLYNSCNFTCTFTGTTGTQTADCIGLNIGPVTVGLTYTLLAYDTFTEVTGIDSTFTISVNFGIYTSSV